MAEADELITWLGFKFKPDAKKNIESAQKSLDMIKDGVRKIGTFFLGASGAIGYFTNDVMRGAQEMSDLSKKTGISTDALQQWKYVAEASGQSFEGLVGDLQNFKKVGIDAISLSGRLQGMSSRIALQWKDKLGLSDDMFNVLRQGPEQVKKLMSEAYIIPKESIEKTAEFNKKLNATKNTLIAMKNEIFMAVSPVLVDLITKFKDWMAVNKEWMKTKLVNVIEGVALGFRRFADIAGTALGYIVDIAKYFGLIADDSPQVESVAMVVTSALLLWGGSKIIAGVTAVTGLLKGLIGFFTADIAVGSTLGAWGTALLGFAADAAVLASALYALVNIFDIWKAAFTEENIGDSVTKWRKQMKQGEDIGFWKWFYVNLHDFYGNEYDFAENIIKGKPLGESWDKFTTGVKNQFGGDIVPQNPRATSNVKQNSDNTIYLQMPYENAVQFVEDITGRQPMTTVIPGAFGGNVQ